MVTQIRTHDNVRFEEPLSELFSIRVTEIEKIKLDSVSRENYISISELVRNLIRDNLWKYVISENLKKTMRVSNEIDRGILEKRLISSRNETNLSKIREILTDFEGFLEEHSKRIDYDELEIRRTEVEGLIKLIYETDTFLSRKIDQQVRRIFKNRHYKACVQEKLC